MKHGIGPLDKLDCFCTQENIQCLYFHLQLISPTQVADDLITRNKNFIKYSSQTKSLSHQIKMKSWMIWIIVGTAILNPSSADSSDSLDPSDPNGSTTESLLRWTFDPNIADDGIIGSIGFAAIPGIGARSGPFNFGKL